MARNDQLRKRSCERKDNKIRRTRATGCGIEKKDNKVTNGATGCSIEVLAPGSRGEDLPIHCGLKCWRLPSALAPGNATHSIPSRGGALSN